jgi:hypothetical protein
MILLAALLFSLVLMLWGIGHLRGDLLTRGPVKLVLFPGLILDGLARTLSCLATATPVVGLSPWRDGTPFLIEGECTLQRLGVPLTTAFRLGALYLGFSVVVLWMPEAMQLVPDPAFLGRSLEHSIGAFSTALLSAPFELLATGLVTWCLLAWLAVTVLAAGLRPRECGVAMLMGTAIVGVMEAAQWLGLRFGAFTNGWFLRRFYEAEAGRALVLMALVAAAVLATLTTMHLIPMLVQKIRPRPELIPEDSEDHIISHF